MVTTRHSITLLIGASLILATSNVVSAEFRAMGDLPGGINQSMALAITPDGKTVVGTAYSGGGLEAVRWTLADGLEALGDLPGGSYLSRALDISDDGSVIAGRASSALGIEAFRWTLMKGLYGLGDLPGGQFKSLVRRMSADGSILVGITGTAEGSEAMRWTESEGMQALGDLPGGAHDSWAYDISSDGSVIVGYAHSDLGKEAFRWTKESGMVSLGDLPGGKYESTAFAISRDGKTIVGQANNDSGSVAVRWTDSVAEILSGTNEGLTNARATAISDNGALIAGTSNEGVFIWDKVNGPRLLKNVLKNEYNIDIPGWMLLEVTDISADGSTLVGYGINSISQLEGWMAKIDVINTPPVANAGKDKTVFPHSEVMLDGSASTDPDNDFTLKYHWNIVYKPEGSNATLSDPDAVKPVMTTDKIGDYIVELVVTDSFNEPSAPDSVIISTVNSQPVANAGEDQSVILHGTAIELNGTNSNDPDGDGLTYKWRFIHMPVDSKTTFNSDSVVNPVFIADAHGTYEIELVVTDIYGFVSDPDVVVVSFNNLAPVAKAGDDQNVFTHHDVMLDGSKSHDPNMDALSYHWVMVSMPEGSTANLMYADSATPVLVPDVEGSYVIGLTVSDGMSSSEPDNVVINAINVDTAVLEALDNMSSTVGSLDDSVFGRAHKHDNKKNKNKREYKHHGRLVKNVLMKKITSVKKKIAAGEMADAMDKLNHDVLKRFDGCAVKGSVDRNDWLNTCDAQSDPYAIGELIRGLLKLN